jgi:hypothetical protein
MIGYRRLPALLLIQATVVLFSAIIVLIGVSSPEIFYWFGIFLPPVTVLRLFTSLFAWLPSYVISTIVVFLYIENATANWRQIVTTLTWSTLGRLWGVFWRWTIILWIVLIAGVLLIVLSLSVFGSFLHAPKLFMWSFVFILGFVCALVIAAVLASVTLSSIAAVTENAPPRKLMRRSFEMTLKQWRKAIVFIAIFLAITAAETVLPQAMVRGLPHRLTESESLLLADGISLILFAMTGGVTLVLPVVLYVDSRCRMDGFHLESLRE